MPRGEATDVDIVFDVDHGGRFGLFDQGRIQTDLAEMLDAGVDPVTGEGLHAAMRARVERQRVRAF